tara:strand:- start:9001 stop:10437 length:1437 start_codon:yes stop_codon:yes gene_type:complete
MAEGKKKGNPLINGIIGLIFLGGSIGAIWKNEHRFDYYQAAKATEPAEAVGDLTADHLFSHTGSMDQDLTMKGSYVQSFQGFLEVSRSAEIYAWDRDQDDDGVTWSKEWMSSLENNSRNSDFKKLLTSTKIRPKTYQVAELKIAPKQIQFVDENAEIPPSSLQLSKKGTDQKLVATQGRYFYLFKGGENELGDERLSYRGLPVPETATYFGKWGEGIAVAHQAEKKSGLISGMISDRGILHHLVAGERETALDSIKAHLARLKNIVRIAGIAGATLGSGIFFFSLTRVLIFIPLIGPFVNRLSGWLGMLLGFLLGLITLVIAFLTSQPLILALFILALGAGLFSLWKNAKRKRAHVQTQLFKTLGHFPSQNELGELEFIKLWQLVAGDSEITASEQKMLNKWTKRHRWSSAKVVELTQRAREELSKTSKRENLESLIQFSLADGRIDRAEMKSLEHGAKKIGVRGPELSTMILQLQRD